MRRLVVVIVLVWVLLGIVALIAFNIGDSTPGDGRGDTIEQSAGT
ncbi:MAG TPA: hypothetical protein VF236_04710 [Gaiellaceae bacterium]